MRSLFELKIIKIRNNISLFKWKGNEYCRNYLQHDIKKFIMHTWCWQHMWYYVCIMCVWHHVFLDKRHWQRAQLVALSFSSLIKRINSVSTGKFIWWRTTCGDTFSNWWRYYVDRYLFRFLWHINIYRKMDVMYNEDLCVTEDEMNVDQHGIFSN